MSLIHVRKYAHRLIYKQQRNRIMSRMKNDEGDPLAPTPAQISLQNAIDRACDRLFLLWGRRGSKSAAMAIEGLTEMSFGPPKNLPLRNVQISGLENNVTDRIFGYMWKALVDDQILGYAPLYKSTRSRYIQMPWGSRVDGKNTMDPTDLLGEGLVLALVDEHAKDDPIILSKYIEPSTFDVNGRIIAATTPLGKSNHATKTYLAWKELAKADPTYYTSKFTSYDNPHLDHSRIDKYKLECIAQGRLKIFLQEVMAELTALSGSVFEHFQPERDGKPWHVKDDLVPIEGIPIIGGVDWGTRHPYCFLIGQRFGNKFRIFSETHIKGLSTSGWEEKSREAVQDFVDKHGKFEMDIVYPDVSLPGAILHWEDLGWPMFNPTSKERKQYHGFEAGVATINDLFFQEEDGEPLLEIDSSCENLHSQLESTVWSDDPHSKRPKKEEDDASDPFRYMCQGEFGLEDTEPVMFSF